MRSAADSTFLKLWGRIEDGLQAGNYTWEIENREKQSEYDVSKWSGEKHLVLLSPSVWGGTSTFLGALYLAGSGLALLLVLYLWLKRSSVEQISHEDTELKWD